MYFYTLKSLGIQNTDILMYRIFSDLYYNIDKDVVLYMWNLLNWPDLLGHQKSGTYVLSSNWGNEKTLYNRNSHSPVKMKEFTFCVFVHPCANILDSFWHILQWFVNFNGQAGKNPMSGLLWRTDKCSSASLQASHPLQVLISILLQ